ncbi:UNKNOWN [Stylonychia lemnae]|uniref:Uncharacterized protein n=1 Tax=Stylonychia lemnae TaxID=5949 RepID=A0A078ALT8_STYLE|nr:UNKNOWN [Stylonychia lemnae]|eukprot:CDW81813.1 UNKNOWN [Stylonychia lemnae]
MGINTRKQYIGNQVIETQNITIQQSQKKTYSLNNSGGPNNHQEQYEYQVSQPQNTQKIQQSPVNYQNLYQVHQQLNKKLISQLDASSNNQQIQKNNQQQQSYQKQIRQPKRNLNYTIQHESQNDYLLQPIEDEDQEYIFDPNNEYRSKSTLRQNLQTNLPLINKQPKNRYDQSESDLQSIRTRSLKSEKSTKQMKNYSQQNYFNKMYLYKGTHRVSITNFKVRDQPILAQLPFIIFRIQNNIYIQSKATQDLIRTNFLNKNAKLIICLPEKLAEKYVMMSDNKFERLIEEKISITNNQLIIASISKFAGIGEKLQRDTIRSLSTQAQYKKDDLINQKIKLNYSQLEQDYNDEDDEHDNPFKSRQQVNQKHQSFQQNGKSLNINESSVIFVGRNTKQESIKSVKIVKLGEIAKQGAKEAMESTQFHQKKRSQPENQNEQRLLLPDINVPIFTKTNFNVTPVSSNKSKLEKFTPNTMGIETLNFTRVPMINNVSITTKNAKKQNYSILGLEKIDKFQVDAQMQTNVQDDENTSDKNVQIDFDKMSNQIKKNQSNQESNLIASLKHKDQNQISQNNDRTQNFMGVKQPQAVETKRKLRKTINQQGLILNRHSSSSQDESDYGQITQKYFNVKDIILNKPNQQQVMQQNSNLKTPDNKQQKQSPQLNQQKFQTQTQFHQTSQDTQFTGFMQRRSSNPSKQNDTNLNLTSYKNKEVLSSPSMNTKNEILIQDEQKQKTIQSSTINAQTDNTLEKQLKKITSNKAKIIQSEKIQAMIKSKQNSISQKRIVLKKDQIVTKYKPPQVAIEEETQEDGGYTTSYEGSNEGEDDEEFLSQQVSESVQNNYSQSQFEFQQDQNYKI